MKHTTAIACMMMLALSVAAETFSLKDTATDTLYGPFPFLHGERINVQGTRWRLIRIDPRHNVILERTHEIVIPSLDFREADIRDVALFLTYTCRRVDENAPDIHVSRHVKSSRSNSITLSIRDLSLYDTLCIISEMSGTQWGIRYGSIMLDPSASDTGPPMHAPVPADPTAEWFMLDALYTDRSNGPFRLSNRNLLQTELFLMEVVLSDSDAPIIPTLKSLRIPSLDLTNPDLETTVRLLNDSLSPADRDTGPVIKAVPGDTAEGSMLKASCSIRDRSAYETLNILCETMGLYWYTREGQIILEPSEP